MTLFDMVVNVCPTPYSVRVTLPHMIHSETPFLAVLQKIILMILMHSLQDRNICIIHLRFCILAHVAKSFLCWSAGWLVGWLVGRFRMIEAEFQYWSQTGKVAAAQCIYKFIANHGRSLLFGIQNVLTLTHLTAFSEWVANLVELG